MRPLKAYIHIAVVAMACKWSHASPISDRFHPLLNLRSGSNKKITTNTSNTPPSIQSKEILSPLQTFTKTIFDARRHLIAAAVARGVSILSMYPMGRSEYNRSINIMDMKITFLTDFDPLKIH